MADDDEDKTVFGGKLPQQPAQPPRAAPASPGADRTVIGGALPPQRPAQSGFGQPAPPAGDNTWLGGALPPMGQPAPGAAPGSQQGFFPDVPGNQQPAQAAPQGPRIALSEALKATGLGKGGPSNPMLAAAANLLILFGRLRTGMVEMQAEPLMNHVVREIEAFERNAVQEGADAQEARVGTYVLCGTADDIVQNLPGTDKSAWLQYSMVARFFQKRDSGIGFFQEAEKAMQAPAQRYDLLELMLVCLSLGFEGQYRTMPNGATELARIRAAIYETLRRVKARPDEDIAVNWTAVPLKSARRSAGVPMWIVASVAAVLVVGGYAGLSTYVNREGGAVATSLFQMHPNVANISLLRTAPVLPFIPPPEDTTQLDRIRASLADQITAGAVEVDTKGNFIFVRVGNKLLFDSGRADVKPEFSVVAGQIAETLNAEQGPIVVQGFTDDVPPSGRGRYKTNLDLSVARATGVKDVLAPLLTDAARLTVEGRGEADPIADNGTAEGRALNRRVEILMAKEGTF